jgi:hypothetical protein
MLPFTFPVWVIVNEERHPEDGYPFYLLICGGPPTLLPATLPVFTAEKNANNFLTGPPFKVVEVDYNTFCEILRECRHLDDVGLDLGTPNAVVHRIERLLTVIEPDQQG